MAKPTNPILTTYRNKIQPRLRIIVSLQSNGPSVVEMGIVFIHRTYHIGANKTPPLPNLLSCNMLTILKTMLSAHPYHLMTTGCLMCFQWFFA